MMGIIGIYDDCFDFRGWLWGFVQCLDVECGTRKLAWFFCGVGDSRHCDNTSFSTFQCNINHRVTAVSPYTFDQNSGCSR